MSEENKQTIPKKALVAASLALALKMQLETSVKNMFSKFFADYERDVFGFYANTGFLRLPLGSIEGIEEIISNHYLNVSSRFRNHFRGMYELRPDQISSNSEIDAELDKNFAFEANVQAANHAREILITTEANIRSSVGKAIEFFAAAGIIASRQALAKKAREFFENYWKNRVETIAITETQTAAENAKKTEINTILQLNPNLNEQISIENVWITTVDEVTRLWHEEANGQRVPLNQPFIVNGERLKYPSDTSLGATASNVINCRCSAEVIVTIKI